MAFAKYASISCLACASSYFEQNGVCYSSKHLRDLFLKRINVDYSFIFFGQLAILPVSDCRIRTTERAQPADRHAHSATTPLVRLNALPASQAIIFSELLAWFQGAAEQVTWLTQLHKFVVCAVMQ